MFMFLSIQCLANPKLFLNVLLCEIYENDPIKVSIFFRTVGIYVNFTEDGRIYIPVKRLPDSSGYGPVKPCIKPGLQKVICVA
jgi:hypothetical protein